jgi:hypothetical protein
LFEFVNCLVPPDAPPLLGVALSADMHNQQASVNYFFRFFVYVYVVFTDARPTVGTPFVENSSETHRPRQQFFAFFLGAAPLVEMFATCLKQAI